MADRKRLMPNGLPYSADFFCNRVRKEPFSAMQLMLDFGKSTIYYAVIDEDEKVLSEKNPRKRI